MPAAAALDEQPSPSPPPPAPSTSSSSSSGLDSVTGASGSNDYDDAASQSADALPPADEASTEALLNGAGADSGVTVLTNPDTETPDAATGAAFGDTGIVGDPSPGSAAASPAPPPPSASGGSSSTAQQDVDAAGGFVSSFGRPSVPGYPASDPCSTGLPEGGRCVSSGDRAACAPGLVCFVWRPGLGECHSPDWLATNQIYEGDISQASAGCGL